MRQQGAASTLETIKQEFDCYLKSLKQGYRNKEQQDMVRRLYETLNDELETMEHKIIKFKRQIIAFKPTIEKSVDQPFLRFLKTVLNILSLGYAARQGLFSPKFRATSLSNTAYEALSEALNTPVSDEMESNKELLEHELAEINQVLARKLAALNNIKAQEAQHREESRNKVEEAELATHLNKVFQLPAQVTMYPGENVIIILPRIEASALDRIQATFAAFISDEILTIQSKHTEDVGPPRRDVLYMHPDWRPPFTPEPYIQITFPSEQLDRVKQGLALSTGVDLSNAVSNQEMLAYC